MGLVEPPPNPSTQLMQLGKAEPLGVLHDHYGGVGDVHSDLDHRRGHQEIDRMVGKSTHHLLASVSSHPAVDQSDSVVAEDRLEMRRHLGCGLDVELHRLLDEGVDDIGLTAVCQLTTHEVVDLGPS